MVSMRPVTLIAPEEHEREDVLAELLRRGGADRSGGGKARITPAMTRNDAQTRPWNTTKASSE